MTGARPHVPVLPTLRLSLLAGVGAQPAFLPFTAATARYVYFARNAIWLTARLMGLAGKEVLVPAYHHGVEMEALVAAGVRLRFFPVGPRWEVDPDDVRRRIGRHTGALYLIHYCGFPGPVQELRRLADDKGLLLLEDCALGLLSCDRERQLGSTGDVAFFCLYKTLPVPHGGAVVINRPDPVCFPEFPPPPWLSTWRHLAASFLEGFWARGGGLGAAVRSAAKRLGWIARERHVPVGTPHFDLRHVDLGISALALRLIQRIDPAAIVEARRRNYFFLQAALRGIAEPVRRELPPGACPLFFPLVVDDKVHVAEALRARGIDTVDFWRHFHVHCDPAEFPDVARLRRRVLEIPCHQDLDRQGLEHLARSLREVLGSHSITRGRINTG